MFKMQLILLYGFGMLRRDVSNYFYLNLIEHISKLLTATLLAKHLIKPTCIFLYLKLHCFFFVLIVILHVCIIYLPC